MNIYAVMAVFVLSGAVILYLLQKMHFTVAKNLFLVLFGVVSIYLPYVVGGKLTLQLFAGVIIRNELGQKAFRDTMERGINGSFPYFCGITAVLAVAMLIVLIAFAVVLYFATVEIIRFVRRIRAKGYCISNRLSLYMKRRANSPIYWQKVYLRFCRINC